MDMKTLKFKTNIKCQGCVETVRRDMDGLVGAGHWSVDLLDPERILTVETETAAPEQVVYALAKTSYTATPVSN